MNMSSSGEEWAWTFGDGSTSTLKSPTHTYKKPGTYIVSLMVDNKKSLVAKAPVTVTDTIPTFSCADSVFYIFRDYTFTADIYNPYNYPVSYLWYRPDSASSFLSTDSAMTGSSLHVYFTQPAQDAGLGLRVILNGDTTFIEKTMRVQNRLAKSLLLRKGENKDDYRQRIFGTRAGQPHRDPTATTILDKEQDTVQTYNGNTFGLSALKTLFPELQGFRIANRKIYYRTFSSDNRLCGLWVANIDGSYPVCIDSLAECRALTIDTEENRLYWAIRDSVWYMPLVGSDNNRFVTRPTWLKTESGVSRLAIDYELK